MSNIEIVEADYSNPKHAKDIVFLLDGYAQDPMGGAKPLKTEIKNNLISALSKRSDAFSILAYVGDRPAGLANCFEGFSTFKCKPLINIHDMAVYPEFRGMQISQKILKKIEQIALERNACKITLEVLSENEPAQKAYKKFGFEGYALDPEKGHALFWEKSI
ncbi:MAG: GNAT family N-acetyltransferase [Pseudomonadota bacterium]